MQGRRAPELAAGALEAMVNKLCELGLSEVASNHLPFLASEPTQWAKVVADFERGRAHIHLTLGMKLSFWTQQPL